MHCKTCKYWINAYVHLDTHDEDYKHCTRYPPVVNFRGATQTPVTHETNSCGEHAEKDK